MKGRIVGLLKAHEGIMSGAVLSDQLGISRVSVWKHIHGLLEMGYPIAASARGYLLESCPDLLYAWEFPGREDRIHHYPEVDSTMEIARKLAREDCPEFSLVVAERQRQGRGRLRRVWRSAVGGLYFTVVTRPRIPAVFSARVSLLAALVLAEVLCRCWQVEARVKWPNDVLVGEKKISGLLSEMEAAEEQVAFVNIGMGINVNNDPSADEPNATTLKRLTGGTVRRQQVLAAFLDAFEARLGAFDGDEVIAEWRRSNATLGRTVNIVTARSATTGIARDIDPHGALILELADGSTRTVHHGDCFHQDPATPVGS